MVVLALLVVGVVLAYGRVCCQGSLGYKAKCQHTKFFSLALQGHKHRVDENLHQGPSENTGHALWTDCLGQVIVTGTPVHL